MRLLRPLALLALLATPPAQAWAAPSRALPAVVPSSAKALGLGLQPQRGLPAPVQAMRKKILEAAFRGEVAKLGRIATEGRPGFDCSFGLPISPHAFWVAEERRGAKVLALMVRTLRLPYGKQGSSYVWPAAAGDAPTEADWKALVNLYGQRQVTLWQGPEHSGYTGMRLGIAPDGDWLFAIAGD